MKKYEIGLFVCIAFCQIQCWFFDIDKAIFNILTIICITLLMIVDILTEILFKRNI